MFLDVLDRFGRQPIACTQAIKVAVALIDHTLISRTKPDRCFHQRIRHFLQIESRAADDFKHVGGRSPPALPFFTDKNFEPAPQALAGRPNIDKPEEDKASDQEHPKLKMNIRDRKVRDQPLPHLLSPPLDLAPPIIRRQK